MFVTQKKPKHGFNFYKLFLESVMRYDVVKTLMERDDYSEADAMKALREILERIYEGEDPDDVLYDWGLEPDYLDELF